MRITLRLPLVVFGTAAIWIKPVSADEQLVPLAVSGDWTTFEHRDGITSPKDACVLMNPNSGVASRAGSTGMELRITDEKWSLPSGVMGTIQLKVGAATRSFGIAGNTDTAVAAIVSEPDMFEVFDAMVKSSVMLVAAG